MWCINWYMSASYIFTDWEYLIDFLLSGVKKLLPRPSIKPTTLDLSSQSGAFDQSTMATPLSTQSPVVYGNP